jgi:hypothetical protein
MTESFEVSGSVALLVQEEIEKPEDWEIMSERGRRTYIVSEIDADVELPPEHEFITEILHTAEELFDNE